MKYHLPFNPPKIVCISPRALPSVTKSLLSTRQSKQSRRIPSFFPTHTHCATHGDTQAGVIPR